MKKKTSKPELTEAKAKVNVEAGVSQRCEGYRRHGGIMTLGPVTWKQCENKADVILRIQQEGEKAKDMPACMQFGKKHKTQDGILKFYLQNQSQRMANGYANKR